MTAVIRAVATGSSIFSFRLKKGAKSVMSHPENRFDVTGFRAKCAPAFS